MPFVKHSDAGDGGGGAATNCHDFIVSKLIPFLTSSTHFPTAGDRWTLERTDNVASNEVEAFLSPPSNTSNVPVIAFHTREDACYIFAGTSYAGGTDSYALPGNTRQFPHGAVAGGTGPEFDPSINGDRKHCSWTNAWPTGGLVAHWLFAPADGSYCYAVVQLESRRFRHIMFGAYDKFVAAMTGGEFFGAQYWDQSVSHIDQPYSSGQHSGPLISQFTSLGSGIQASMFRAAGLRDGAAVAPDAEWFCNGRGFSSASTGNPKDDFQRPETGTWDTSNNTAIDIGHGCVNALGAGSPGSSFLFHVKQSLIANVRPLMPITLWAQGVSEGQDRFMPVGQMPDLFRVNTQGFTAGQDIVVGSDTYSLFPIVNSDQINTADGDEYSGFDGFAVRQRA